MADDAEAALEELLQFIYLTPVGIIKFRRNGEVDLSNPAALKLLLPLVPGGDFTNLYEAVFPLAPGLRHLVESFTAPAGWIIEQHQFEHRTGGKPCVLSLSLQRVNDSVFMAVVEDITNLVEQGRRLAANHRRFHAIFDSVRDYAMFTVDVDGAVEEWNHSLERFGGWTARDVEGRDIGFLFASDDVALPSPGSLLADARRSGSAATELPLRRRDGTQLWGSVVVTALPDQAGVLTGFMVVARDVTGRKRLEDELRELASVDPLTGAFNRRYASACMTAELERRSRSGISFAVMMVDIDRFKAINDTFGHDAGDRVLCAIVGACKLNLRILDVLARWGGEEFLIVLPGTAAEGAIATAERLRANIAELRIPILKTTIAVTVSIGIAVASDNDAAELLRRADDALYAAKTAGRDRVVLAA